MDLRNTHLVSDRLSLQAFKPADADEVFDGVTPGITRFMAFEPTPSRQVFAEIWGSWFSMMAAGTDVLLVVRRRETGTFLGMTGLHKIDTPNPEPGVWMREDARGQAYGLEAVSTVVRWARETLRIPSLIYPVAQENHPSRHLAEKLGGVVSGSRTLAKPGGLLLRMLLYRIDTQRDSLGRLPGSSD